MTRMTVKEEQRSSMRAVYEGSDVFVWLPTGYGKSLCYLALPFLMDYKKGLVDSGKSCGVLLVSPLIALMHAYAGVFTQTSSVTPNPFANVTIKIDVIFTFKLNACANSVYQAFPPRFEGLGTRLMQGIHENDRDSSEERQERIQAD